MNYKENISRNIKMYLNYSGKTQTDLAKFLNVTKAAVSSWINCKSMPDIDSIIKICDFLDITINDIVEVYYENQVSSKDLIFINNYKKSKHKESIDVLLGMK